MTERLQRLRNEIALLQLEPSLLFLNRALARERARARKASGPPEAPGLVLPHVVRFLAGELLALASPLGPVTLSNERFEDLCSQVVELDDPIQLDPRWPSSDPTGALERMLGLQVRAQDRLIQQQLGLALGLFRDVGPVATPKPFDLRVELEAELGVSLESFMQFGFLASGLRSVGQGKTAAAGTFTFRELTEAYVQGFECCTPEVWTAFLRISARTLEEFRELAKATSARMPGSVFEPFALNLLTRHPIVRLDEDHFLAVDPELVLERVSLGMYYDLLEVRGRRFTTCFGHAFSTFVGQLLGSVLPASRLSSDADWKPHMPRPAKGETPKHGDWAYQGDAATVLLECKGLRPNLALIESGSSMAAEDYVVRLAGAVEQLASQAPQVEAGIWDAAGLRPRRCLGLVVTFGKFYTANTPFVRERVAEHLAAKQRPQLPFVVLSIEELDTVVRLVELGETFEGVVGTLGRAASADLLRLYPQTRKSAISEATRTRAAALLNSMRPASDAP